MLPSRKRGGSTPCRLGGVPQRGVVAVQSANVGSRFLAMCEVLLAVHDCDGGVAMVARVDAVNEILDSSQRCSQRAVS